LLLAVDFGSAAMLLLRLLPALLALAFSLWRRAACALLAFLVPLLAAPRLPLLRLESLSDLGLLDFMGISGTAGRTGGRAPPAGITWIQSRQAQRGDCRSGQPLRVGKARTGASVCRPGH
jgi:hypothetical protein